MKRFHFTLGRQGRGWTKNLVLTTCLQSVSGVRALLSDFVTGLFGAVLEDEKGGGKRGPPVIPRPRNFSMEGTEQYWINHHPFRR